MLIRRDQMRASQIMQQRIRESSNIKIYWNTTVEEILGDTKVDGVRIKNTSTGKVETIPVHGFFVAIGHEPNSGIFKEWLDMDETGYIKTIPGSTRTNIEGVYAAGDVQDKIYRQAVTAAGSGCMAALDAERWLSLQAKA
jgi:thioredoxin reductase (NADPH)